MKKLMTAMLLFLLSQLALALPTPKDIEAAVRGGQLSQAESMLREVIGAKPGSAKAHYELGQVLAREGRRADALQALQQARQLDPDMRFTGDPRRFQHLLDQLQGAANPALPSPGNLMMKPQPQAGAPFPWSWVLIGGGLGVLMIVLWRRMSAPSSMVPMGGGGAGNYGPAPMGQPGYGQVPPSGGSGMGGAVLGGLAGMAAGYGLAKVLEHGNDQPLSTQGGRIIDMPPPQPDYGGFDAGTGDSWDAQDASAGGDDW